MTDLFLSENEIEIFERKFLAPLSVSRSVSSTRIVITDAGDSVSHAPAPDRVISQVMTSSPGARVPAQHVRVLRTSSKVSVTTESGSSGHQDTVLTIT